MALRRFEVIAGNFSLRTDKGKQRYTRGQSFIAFDYQVPELIRDVVKPMEEITNLEIKKEYEPEEVKEAKETKEAIKNPSTKRRGRPKKEPQTKQEELRPIPLEDGKWDVVNVVTEKKVNDKPMTVEEVATLIEGFVGVD